MNRINKPRLVIITGCAGAGKTTLGKKISKELNYTYIDKDTVVNSFTDFILELKENSNSSRESDLYCNVLRPIEYKTVFKLCKENLELNNSVILSIPFISQITNYSKWLDIKNEFNFNNEKFVWINHNEGNEYARLLKRNSKRDIYKLKNWEEYIENLGDIKPDNGYNSFCFDNVNSNTEYYKSQYKDLIQWLKQ